MATYACIGCGATKDSKSNCSCSDCGFTMFETPYDRKTILTREIEKFICSLEVKTISKDDVIFEGIEKDNFDLPKYSEIIKAVSKIEKTEVFLGNILKLIKQLKMNSVSKFSKTYSVSFEKVDEKIGKYDLVLTDAMRVLYPGTEFDFKKVEWDHISLLYSKCPNENVWIYANELIIQIEVLISKMDRFIKTNNLYGDAHKYYPPINKVKHSNCTDFKNLFEKAIVDTYKINHKKYIVDIMDDGESELEEMLTCLWRGIELILNSSLFTESYKYVLESHNMNEEEFLSHCSVKTGNRYGDIDKSLSAKDWLCNKTEEELFAIYKKLISFDKFGFFSTSSKIQKDITQSEKKLHSLIGLESVKESISKIKAYALANRNNEKINIHMCFLGNPGTGKTEVARCIADILYDNKILPTNKVVEVDRSGLVSQYFGATAEKTRQVIESAMGGVLFIDEAYALGNNVGVGITDYGKEAIDTLVKAMEDYRGKFCVIFAGYKNEMLQMLATNPGFKSRIQFMLDFPNYSRNELQSIIKLMIVNQNYTIRETAISRILDITDIKRKSPEFANAREIRNILDQVIMYQSLRCAGTDDREIGVVDVNKYIYDEHINLPIAISGDAKRILTSEEQLEQLIGLDAVKRIVRKIKAYAKRNIGKPDLNLHMCFYGNPGTGKTEIARIISGILYDVGVLKEAKIIETDSNGLIGRFVGETAPKTKAIIDNAMNGVLFIDEAYGLAAGGSTSGINKSYGNEAVSVLLKEMEDRRGQFCVIFAGYENEMDEMLNVNPGLKSRVQFVLKFPDYTRNELREIAHYYLANKNYVIDSDAVELVLDITDYYRNCPNFANARTLRNILDQVLLNQNLRTEESEEDIVILADVEEYIRDEGIELTNCIEKSKKIGFR